MEYECNGYQISKETSENKGAVFSAYANVIMGKKESEEEKEKKIMNYDEFKLLVKENISRFFTSENRIKDITLKQICKMVLILMDLL